MLTKFNLILIFKYFKILFANLIGVFFLFFSCEDANYQLDNPFDPENMDLDPPALFFHPYEITTSLDNSFSVEVYGLELEPAAGAHIDVRYDWGSVHIDSVVPGPFFTGDNNPMEITVDDIQGILDIFIYYLPDMESDQSQGGTWSLATIYFTAYTTGGSELLFGENTKLRDKDNLDVFINEFGSGYINVE
tara:strand:+ start:275 stop:847 length:573 start_codon:yes stop_codon:yes gene_type:complete